MSEEEEILLEVDPFRLLVDKNVGSVVVTEEWCPTMDLLVLMNEKNEVWIQRAGSGSSWTKLSSLSPSSNYKTISLSWRFPDGLFIFTL